MPLCIYCDENKATSGEHYLPACLGNFQNYEQLHNKLCSKCNGTIGLLDEQFCRCGPEAFFRIILGIKGRKHHKKVNPIYRGSAGGKRIVIEADHPKLDCKIFCEIEEGSENVFPARQIIVIDSNEIYHSILVTENIKDSDDLKKELNKRELLDSKVVECWASPEEQDWIEGLCEGLDFRINWSDEIPYQIVEKTRIAATFTVNDYYFRAIAKIAFHYFLKFFNQFSGNEKQFDGIKQFILSGGNSDNWVRQVKGSFIICLNPGFTTTDRYCHIIAVDKDEKNILARINFFIGPKGVPPHYYEVFIGRNPEKIIFPQGIGHQFVYYDELDKDGYCGRMDPLLSVRKSLML